MDTNGSDPNWQKLSTQLTIPSNTDHVMIKVTSAVASGDGVAYADDVKLCMDGACSPCAGP